MIELNSKNAKLSAMISFFESWENRLHFLKDLFEQNHQNEALLLSCCYIEGFANQIYSDERSNWNFYRILKEHGGDYNLLCIHPEELKIGLSIVKNKNIREIGKKIDEALSGVEKRLYDIEEMFNIIVPNLPEEEATKLKNHLWRGTLASFAYRRIRCEHVHNLIGPRQFLSLTDDTDFPDFNCLYAALMRIFKAIRKMSIESGKWFGNDQIFL